MPTTEKQNGLERSPQPAGEHLAPESPRDFADVRCLVDRPVFDSDRRGIKQLDIPRAVERSRDVDHHKGRRADLLQGLGTKVRPGNRLSSRLATLRGRLGYPDALFRR